MKHITPKELAETCHYKGKTYEFYCHRCLILGFAAMTEREFISIGDTCEL